ncbi:TRAP transporter small permease [Lichenifustis flavocetrariae]|uniref:TRAP transporter small permease protein n=1 Tax=Lichenifustis flavocetrariae TaxID=2949735 RepID=A0AA41YQJ8_9HYPH|nr:TRAP transporter small permease subunit [Lichenifustis flavocetrariae]MCW6506711.1 TRAP transporter small permease [Lichenifustis flavocetrariae]
MRFPLRLLTAAGIGSLLVMVAATLIAVVTRFLGTTGFEWSYEVAGIAFIWTTFLGAGLAEARRENAAFEVLRSAASPPWQRLLEKLGAVVVLIVGAALLVSGIAAIDRSGLVPTPLLRWPGFVQLTAAPVLGACLGVLALRRLFGRVPPSEAHAPATVGQQGAGTPV